MYLLEYLIRDPYNKDPHGNNRVLDIERSKFNDLISIIEYVKKNKIDDYSIYLLTKLN